MQALESIKGVAEHYGLKLGIIHEFASEHPKAFHAHRFHRLNYPNCRRCYTGF